ncbi:DUF2922 domain-containing protein [Ornithinibacillus bavariensis]|uniref:Potassium channel protein n=1 Tax=Ornithinibacillus bavariensis TaxID=545502 RepID=A0A919X9H1_9BACI|nr:DUF2922 domain-containing protein [Ornithinibacillus bavariensis]GIO26970.1 potassium channel protein [Ornithinibacillus bavariensis]HAM80047.1 DUF2922 domain-containing protein [Ornithinibacillus sp.]
MKRLELKFENEEGKIVTYSLEEPIEPVDPVAVTSAMDVILEQNAFSTSGGDLVAKKGARLVENNVQDIEII